MRFNETIQVNNLDELSGLAKELAHDIRQSQESNMLIMFNAEMGAGKTTFTREFGQALGIDQRITSPTFVGMNEYHVNDLNLYHLDLYMVGLEFETISELMDTEGKNIFVCEWSENLEDTKLSAFLKRSDVKIIKAKIDIVNETTRQFAFAD